MIRRTHGGRAARVDARPIRPLWEAIEDFPETALWLWREWGRNQGSSSAETGEWLTGYADPAGREIGFVAYCRTRPVGVALLRDHDLASFRKLTPWLSSLFVLPCFRGTGIGSHLIQAVERAATERDVRRLYLYTPDLERFYARRRWLVHDRFSLNDRDFAVMSRQLVEA